MVCLSIISNARPPPRATQVSGSSATITGSPVSGQQLVEVTQQGATTGQHQATLGDIGRQLWRRLLQRALDRLHDGRQGLLQGFEHFIGVQE